MPDITYSFNASINKSGLTQSFNASNVTANMSNVGLQLQTLTPGTSVATTTSISTASLTAVGWFYARNLSTVETAAVTIGPLSGTSYVPMLNLVGGEVAVGQLAPGSYACQSNLTGTRLVVAIAEN